MTVPLSPEHRAEIAQFIGDAKPVRTSLLAELAKSVADRAGHDHPSQGEDWYCMNLTAWAGERIGPVIRRLLDTEAEVDRLTAQNHTVWAEHGESFRRDAKLIERLGDQRRELEEELAQYRALDLGDLDGRVSASCSDPDHPTWLRSTDDTRDCPWCRIAELEQVAQMRHCGWAMVHLEHRWMSGRESVQCPGTEAAA